MEETRVIHLGPRMEAAMDMLRGSRVVADIGCDHGRLACALLQNNVCARCIATDVSAPSLEKAHRLSVQLGLLDRMELRLGDGFLPLAPGEADAAALLGMGGTLMASLLKACTTPFQGMERIVFQPMRKAEDIRSYLYEQGCRIVDDRVVREGSRLYQVFSALAPSPGRETPPVGWPAGYFSLGYRAFERHDPLFRTLAETRLRGDKTRLARAGDAPTAEKLRFETACLEQILEHFERA